MEHHTRCPGCGHVQTWETGRVKLTLDKLIACAACGVRFKPQAMRKPRRLDRRKTTD